MGMLAWVMIGLALWHYTVFLPDRFWGGIVGAFVGAIVGSIFVGMVIYAAKSGSVKIPGIHDTHLVTALYAVPGALGGMAAVYFEGIRRERLVDSPAD